MGHAIQLAAAQKIRLDNHLSEGTQNNASEFLAQQEEVEVTLKIMKILAANQA